MAPVHDTDIAEERWNQAEWQRYELWEKVEQRLRRQRRLWIAAAVLLFLMISAVPIVRDRWWRWSAQGVARRLAQEVNRIKRDASLDRAAYRIRFAGSGSLQYVIERPDSCSDASGPIVRAGALMPEKRLSSFLLLGPEDGQRLGVPGLVESFCYDYLSGSDLVLNGRSVVGFGIAPAVKDLSELAPEDVAILLLSGPSAEPEF